MDDNDLKKKLGIAMLIAFLLLISTCTIVVVTNTTNSNEVVYEDDTAIKDNGSLSADPTTTIEWARNEMVTVKGKKLSLDLTAPITALQFYKSYSASFRENNTLLYQVTQRFFSPYSTMLNYDVRGYADPLFIMALANVENGGLTTAELLLAPALPTSYGIVPTTDNILTFTYYDMLDYPNALKKDRDSYRGLFQMFVTYGAKYAVDARLLTTSEYAQLLVAEADGKAVSAEMDKLQFVEGSGVYSSIDGTNVSNPKGNYGDRFNYVDCVNRVAGSIIYRWNNTSIKVDNKFEFMAITAMSHNSTPSIFTMPDSANLDSKYYWWPFDCMGDAREYVKKITSDDIMLKLKEQAYSDVKKARPYGTPKFRMTTRDAVNFLNDCISEGLLTDVKYTIDNNGQVEKISYPIQVLYNYFTLEAIYSGN